MTPSEETKRTESERCDQAQGGAPQGFAPAKANGESKNKN